MTGIDTPAANGYYTLFKEIVLDEGHNCAFCPIYLGPTVNGLSYIFSSSSPLNYLRSGTVAMGINTVKSDVQLTIGINAILGAMQSVITSAPSIRTTSLIQSDFFISSVGIIYYQSGGPWEVTDITSSDPGQNMLYINPDLFTITKGWLNFQIQ